MKFQGDRLFVFGVFLQHFPELFWAGLTPSLLILAAINRNAATIIRAKDAKRSFFICIAGCFKGKTKILVNSYKIISSLLKKIKTENINTYNWVVAR